MYMLVDFKHSVWFGSKIKKKEEIKRHNLKLTTFWSRREAFLFLLFALNSQVIQNFLRFAVCSVFLKTRNALVMIQGRINMDGIKVQTK